MLDKNNIPEHIGIIMDGNRRWAKQRGLDPAEGHEAGAQALQRVIEHAEELGVKIVTVYAMSTENFTKRTKKELLALFRILKNYILSKTSTLQKKGVKLTILGELKVFPRGIQSVVNAAVNTLKSNNRLKLNIALNYGGRSELVKAVKQILKEKKNPEEITEETISNALYTKGLKDPDLLVRCGGEKRISNFLIWQLSYSEFYFTDVLWPDFDGKELEKAIIDYQNRERRFGGNSMPIATKKQPMAVDEITI